MEKGKVNLLYNIGIGILVVVVIGLVAMLFTGKGKNEGQASSRPATVNDLVGKKMPEFTFKDINGNAVSSESLKGKKYALFFNEGLMCYPACWNQMLEFSKDERFKSDDMKVLSVVLDPRDGWKSAIAKKPEMGQIDIMFDNGGALSRQLGVLSAKSSMHPGTFPGHTYIVVDKEGTVSYVLDDPNMALNNDLIYGKLNDLK